jgi:hypothetical protein
MGTNEGTTATGNATLSGSNTNIIASPMTLVNCQAAGISGYQVWRTTGAATQGYIGTGACGSSFTDTGIAATGDPYELGAWDLSQALGVSHLYINNADDVDQPAFTVGTPRNQMSSLLDGGGEGALVNLYIKDPGGNNRFVVDFGGFEGPTGGIGAERWMFSTGNGSGAAFFGVAGYVGSGTMDLAAAFNGRAQNRGSGTLTVGRAFGALDAGGSPGILVSQRGYYCEDLVTGTANYCIYSDESAGANKWAYYGAGTAASYFGGQIQDITDIANPFLLGKTTQSASAPGVGKADLRWLAGTNSGTCKLVSNAGTSATEVTIIDNIGGGC